MWAAMFQKKNIAILLVWMVEAGNGLVNIMFTIPPTKEHS